MIEDEIDNSIDYKKLEKGLSTIHKKDNKQFRKGAFVDFTIAFEMPRDLDSKTKIIIKKLKSVQRNMIWDIWNIESTISKINWEKEMWSNGKLHDYLWMQYATCDINFFHIELRLIFDRIAKIISLISDNPEQVPNKSYEKLKNWTEVPSNISIIGRHLSDLFIDVEWFDDIREIRNSLVHQQGQTLVFITKDKITFQIHQGLDRKVLIPELMHNPYVVDFELYAGLYIGYLYSYLDEVAEKVFEKLGYQEFRENAEMSNPGVYIIERWMNNCLSLSNK